MSKKACAEDADPFETYFKRVLQKESMTLDHRPSLTHAGGGGVYRLKVNGDTVQLGHRQLLALVAYVLREQGIHL